MCSKGTAGPLHSAYIRRTNFGTVSRAHDYLSHGPAGGWFGGSKFAGTALRNDIMMKSFAPDPWTGKHKIILGFDVGTTFSGVSYAYLFPNGSQTVSRVSGWPGQEAHKGESKVPTLVWYDRDKKATAFGAEALSAEIEDEAEEKGWTLAKHFKLHLHPQTMKEKYSLTIDRTC